MHRLPDDRYAKAFKGSRWALLKNPEDLTDRLAPYVKAARTMRDRRGIIINAINEGISNGRVEGLNTKVRLIIRRGYGFHSAKAALALVMLACGPINLTLPHEQPALQTDA